jgi:hypothetical protein
MMERGDFEILHEPFSYLYYVHGENATIPQEFIDADHPVTYPAIREMILEESKKKPVFFKDMAAHCYDHLVDDSAFLFNMSNTFLIRDPAKTIASYYALNPDVSRDEIGCEQLHRLYRVTRESTDRTPVIVDADDLEDDPAGTIAAYCDRLGIAFFPHSLNWSPHNSEKWKIWENWHRDAARSSGIVKNLEVFEETIENNTRLRSYYEYHLPFYQEMHRQRIRP